MENSNALYELSRGNYRGLQVHSFKEWGFIFIPSHVLIALLFSRGNNFNFSHKYT
jgi:hypothetical protein